MAAVLVGSTASCSSRALKLFSFGCVLAVVLMTFQYEHKLRLYNSPRLMLTLPALVLVSICGLGAAFVGVVYPMMMNTIHRTSIRAYNNNNESNISKSKVCKSIVIFVGINHLCAKIPFQSDLHFTVTLACFCMAFWWWLDRSFVTFVLSVLVSIILTIAIEILLRSGALEYSDSDFYLKTCVPCLTFAGAILTIQITQVLSPPVDVPSTEEHHPKQE